MGCADGVGCWGGEGGDVFRDCFFFWSEYWFSCFFERGGGDKGGSSFTLCAALGGEVLAFNKCGWVERKTHLEGRTAVTVADHVVILCQFGLGCYDLAATSFHGRLECAEVN